MRDHEAAAATDIGKVRELNEDRSLVEYRHGVLVVAVADGVGGEHGGDVASEAALTELAQAYFRRRRRDAGRTLEEAIEAANSAVLGAAEAKGLKGAATTVVAAVIKGRRAAIANLGDSRAYVLRREQIRQVTKDHTGTLARSITRFAGDPRGVRPDVFREELLPGDRLLLCSDGVTTHLSDAELVPLLAEGDAAIAANRIVHAAVERGGRDNATAVVVVAAQRVLRWDLVALWSTLILAVVAIATTVCLVSPQ